MEGEVGARGDGSEALLLLESLCMPLLAIITANWSKALARRLPTVTTTAAATTSTANANWSKALARRLLRHILLMQI